MSEELMRKAKAAKSAEELNPSAEIDDNDLDAVAGGTVIKLPIQLKCPKCGAALSTNNKGVYCYKCRGL